MASLTIIISLLPVLIQAQDDTSVNQDIDRVGWVSAPNVRGTSDILWSCFAVFLVCTWKCIHLNIPSQQESEAGWHTIGGWLPYWPTRLCWKVFLRKAMWMCIIATAPEFGIAMAVNEFYQSWKLKNRVDSPKFTITHSFYALMGGFVVAIPVEYEIINPSADAGISPDETAKSQPLSSPSLGNLEYYSILSKEQPEDSEDFEKVDPVMVSTILPSITQGSHSIPCFPLITEEDISNQSKSDPFTKAFAVLQCTWLIIQSITRTSQGLRLTELELTTLAFTMCAFIMYSFWWCKPFDAQRPITLLCLDPETSTQIRSNLEPWSVTARKNDISYNIFGGFVAGLASYLHDRRLSVDPLRSAVFHTTAIAFSGIHLIAWNWDFPTQNIRILWRTFSLITTCGPLTLFLISTIFAIIGVPIDEKYDVGDSGDSLIAISMVVITIAYVASRLGLVVLIFYCFSAMPASVYQAPDWNLVLPHFS
ncbi:hypothetical protein BDW59DRAFT_133976 [Aspergillus cavernicola]|uniref:Major facilitator superfamily domain-containing protein n=1 Tax=Aspergillus cavernicola TaxID=176166 RepID=A0ABR4HP99_9EURO